MPSPTPQMAIAVDVSYAPELLIYTLTDWPSVEEQDATVKRLVAGRQLLAHTCAVIDCRALPESPERHDATSLAAILPPDLARARSAYLVKSLAHGPTISPVIAAVSPERVRSFTQLRDALEWLFPRR